MGNTLAEFSNQKPNLSVNIIDTIMFQISRLMHKAFELSSLADFKFFLPI